MSAPTHEHRQFTLERVFASPRAKVWEAWAVPEKKGAWFGNTTSGLDFRPDGREHGQFNDAMGIHTNETRYFEITEGERIVMAYSMALNGRVHTVSLATVAFADEGTGTRLSYTEQMCVIPPSDGVDGRTHGWGYLLDALGAFLQGPAA